jgi:hypothetical protein
MTTELHYDLINFSFNNLHNVFKTRNPDSPRTIFNFVPAFLECLKELVCHYFHSCILCILVFMHFMTQPFPEADHLRQNVQVHFDGMLCDVLKKYYSFPRFTLLLGSICLYMGASEKQLYTLRAGIAASLSLIQKQEGYILDVIGFSRDFPLFLGGTPQYITYFMELLESPERLGTHIFDQKRYATAAKECLQLYLCSHCNFSKGATEFAHHDKALCRNKPWEWVARLGVHSRIRKARHHFKVQQHKSLKAHTYISHIQSSSFPKNAREHEYLRFLTYQWALDLLPFFLERSAISLELADVLRSCTFTTMAQKFPRRRRLAKEAIAKYLLQEESAVGEA